MTTALPEWLERLRRIEIVERVNNDPRSAGGRRLGLSVPAAMEAIGWGQADFDKPARGLAPEDLVILYAYFNQRGHLEELCEAFGMLFADARPDSPIVVDLGCGPFTGGLAIAGCMGPDSTFDYIGVDQSRAMRELGERLSSAAALFDDVPQFVSRWADSIPAISWKLEKPGWRDVIVVVSYLLASPTLDVVELIRELEGLLKKLGRGSVTVLYTNSPRPAPNRSFPRFRKALLGAGYRLYADDMGGIEVDRQGGARERRLRYALFRRPRQDTLQLAEM